MFVTSLHDRNCNGMKATPVFVGLLVAVVLTIGATSCGSADETGSRPGGSEIVEIVVPFGTQARIDRGETVSVMPAKLQLRVGDTLRIRNDDEVEQYVGPYLVLAGQQFELQYGAAGRYEGLCALSGGARYEIVITE